MKSKKSSTHNLNKLLTTEELDIKFLFGELRKSSVIWDGRKEVLRKCRKKVFVKRSKSGTAIYKYHWQCAKCQKWFRDEKMMEVDHIVEIGGYTGHDGDWNKTIARMFPRPIEDHLQSLCIKCHSTKTGIFNSAASKWERKDRGE